MGNQKPSDTNLTDAESHCLYQNSYLIIKFQIYWDQEKRGSDLKWFHISVILFCQNLAWLFIFPRPLEYLP